MMIKMVYGLEIMRLVAGEAFFVCLFVFSDCSHFLLKGRITSLTKSGRYGEGQRYWEKLKGRSKERPMTPAV